MIPPSFEYYAPTSLKGALLLLDRLRDDAKVLAGGHSLIPLMKLRLAGPKYLVDINRIPRMNYIAERGSRMVIGALARHHEIASSKLLRNKCQILSETAIVIGDPQVRNLGTIGGSLAHADPSGDYASTILALNGEIEVEGAKGSRICKADTFFKDMFTTALKPNELITEVSVPKAANHSGGAYLKLERKVGDFATIGVAAQLTLDEKDACKMAGIGLTAVGPTPLKARNAEKVLRGRVLDDDVIADAAEAAGSECQPTSDVRASADYKREMIKVFTKRALNLALKRARGRSGA